MIGARQVSRGGYGGALRLAGAGEDERVPRAPSLDLRRTMTLSAWIPPSDSQDGSRERSRTDVYSSTAAAIAATASEYWTTCVGLLSRRRLVLRGRRRRRCSLGGGPQRSSWPPVALIVAGTVIDAMLAPTGSLMGPSTLIGPILGRGWYALTASQRGEATAMFLIAALLVGVTIASLAGYSVLALARDNGSIARSAALGLILVAVGLLGVRYGARASERPGDLGRGPVALRKRPQVEELAAHHQGVGGQRKHAAAVAERGTRRGAACAVNRRSLGVD